MKLGTTAGIARPCPRGIPIRIHGEKGLSVLPHEGVGGDVDGAVAGGIQGAIDVIAAGTCAKDALNVQKRYFCQGWAGTVVVHGHNHPP